MDNKNISNHNIVQQTRHENRKRLIEHNNKLRKQLIQLSKELEKVINKHSVGVVKDQTNDHEYDLKRKELMGQQRYILKLKNRITDMKNQVMGGEDSQIRRQEDKVTKMKMEIAGLKAQKDTLVKLNQYKSKMLKIRDTPHQSHILKVSELLALTRLQNKQLLDQILQLERKVRKQHQLSIQHKESLSPKKQEKIDNIEYQIADSENEIKILETSSKAIDDKWKPKCEYLDKIYFKMVAIMDAKQKKVEDLEKDIKALEIKKFMQRDEQEMRLVKQRLARIILKQPQITEGAKVVKNNISVQRNAQKIAKEPLNLTQRYEKSLSFSQIKPSRTPSKELDILELQKTKRARNETDKLKQPEQLPIQLPIQLKQPMKQVVGSLPIDAVPNRHNGHAKMIESPTKSGTNPRAKKQNKILKNMGVGTSFYYDEF